MKISRTTLFCVILIHALLVAGCSGPANKAAGDDQQTKFVLPEGENMTASFTDSRLPGMKGVAENEKLKLFINEQTGEIAVINKADNEIFRSNPAERDSDPIASGVNKDLLSAQAALFFYNIYGQISSVNTCTDSAAYKQLAFRTLPGGVSVSYLLGTVEKTIDDMPKMISKKRFEQRLLSKVNKAQKKALSIAYREDKETGLYKRNDGLKGLQLKRALEAFEAAGYTTEDLAHDIAENNLDQEKPIPRLFRLSIEYVLDGDSLVVRVPVSGIRFPEEYPVNYITVLNFFGAGSVDERGSIFVPDGSGALIHFNNGKSEYPSYKQDVYGNDQTIDRTDFLKGDQTVRMPVFGIIKENSAFLGIIEQGASTASINADVSGRTNSYNCVYPSFYVVNKDDVTLNAPEQKWSLSKFQERPVKTDFVIRYVFLGGEDASYQGMARYYRKYLVENNMLSKNNKNQAAEDTAFYLQLIGSISKRKHFLGVPYQALEPLTTLEEAKFIISQLKRRNVNNIKLKYTGWFNGGYDHKAPKSISVDGAIGGTGGLAGFIAYARKENVSFYPDVALLSFKNTSGFSESNEAVRRITGAPVTIYPVDQAMNRRDRERIPAYLLSPRVLARYTESMLEGLEDLSITSISLRDLADQLNSDYRKNRMIDRTESESVSVQALEKIRQKTQNVMADGGNAYAWRFLTEITNAPLSCSNFKLEDESVPFYQMVIRGFIEYTGTPYNLSAYVNHRQYVLKCLEYGSNVFFAWIYESNDKVKDTEYDYLYSVYYNHWIDLAQEIYHEVNGALRHVENQGIIDHRKIADGVYKTVFENNVYIIVNYNRTPVSVDGVTVNGYSFKMGGGLS
ncbi:MAG: DUF5696 domain-containing protein [Bacillota bacterium]